MKRRGLAAAAVFAACATPAFAGGGGMNPIAANLPEQIVQESTLVSQYEQQVMAVQEQIQMFTNMANNTRNLSIQNWPMVAGEIAQLVTLVGQERGLNYATQNTLAAAQQYYGTNALLNDYSQRLQQWNANDDQQIADTLYRYNLSAQGMQTEQQALAAIQAQSQSAVGRMQVLQAANQISGIMVNRLESMHTDINQANSTMISLERERMAVEQHKVEPYLNWATFSAGQ